MPSDETQFVDDFARALQEDRGVRMLWYARLLELNYFHGGPRVWYPDEDADLIPAAESMGCDHPVLLHASLRHVLQERCPWAVATVVDASDTLDAWLDHLLQAWQAGTFTDPLQPTIARGHPAGTGRYQNRVALQAAIQLAVTRLQRGDQAITRTAVARRMGISREYLRLLRKQFNVPWPKKF